MKKAVLISSLIAVVVTAFFYARRTSPFFNLLFPPHDLFQPLTSSDVNVARVGDHVSLTFKPKYPGNHDLDLEVEKLDPGVVPKDLPGFSVMIKNSKGQPVKGRVQPYGSFWSERFKGFPLVSFSVPEDIKIGERSTIEVSVSKPDLAFTKTYGSARLVVSKGSDK